MRTKGKFIVIVALLGLTTITLGADVVGKYPERLHGELDATTTGDAANVDAIANRTIITLASNKNLTLRATFSIAGATCEAGVVRGRVVNGTFISEGSADWATFTAHATKKAGSRFISKDVAFDTVNYEAAIAWVGTPSSGNVVIGWSVH